MQQILWTWTKLNELYFIYLFAKFEEKVIDVINPEKPLYKNVLNVFFPPPYFKNQKLNTEFFKLVKVRFFIKIIETMI